jgi:hypothetical protein
MSPRLESDEDKTGRASSSFRTRLLRAAIVLSAGALLFAAGVFFGRAGRSDDAPRGPAQIVGFDAASIQLLDASLELRKIDDFDAGSGLNR